MLGREEGGREAGRQGDKDRTGRGSRRGGRREGGKDGREGDTYAQCQAWLLTSWREELKVVGRARREPEKGGTSCC